ncbi:MAG: HEAT repeat domain-containing protein, partial [Pirellulaceae bacterium]
MQGRFLLCDFRGQTTGSGIKTFRLNPKGAFFEIIDEENTFWNILATDCCFGPDGRLFVSDWVHGWDGLGKGRIYAFTDEQADKEAIKQVQQLLSGDWSQQLEGNLLRFLNHPDRRVRLQAQFELVRRQSESTLTTGARFGTWKLGRLHGLWGLDQLVRANPQHAELPGEFATLLVECMRDADRELQAQAVRLAGELLQRSSDEVTWRSMLSAEVLSKRKSDNPRVQYFAIMAVGKAGIESSINEIADLLATNDNQDPLLRHAGIMALSWLDSSLTYAVEHESPAVRLAAVVALRKRAQRGDLDAALLEQLLHDPESRVVLETARAIHDLPIAELMPALGKLAAQPELPDALARRVINANFRLGDEDSLTRIHEFVVDKTQLTDRRMEGIQSIGDWPAPPPLDKVTGLWRPLEAGGRANPETTVSSLLAGLNGFDDRLAEELLRAGSNLRCVEALPHLRELVGAEDSSDPMRAWALTALLGYSTDDQQQIIQQAIKSDSGRLRMEALRFLAAGDQGDVLPHLRKAVVSPDRAERQHALSILGEMNDVASAALLRELLDQFASVSLDTRLDLWLAIEARDDNTLQQLRKDFLTAQETIDPQFVYQMTMEGGDAEAGSEIFFNRLDVSCLRCHKIQGSGGDVGPDLSDIGKQRERALLLESLIDPNKTITENYETVVVVDIDGNTHIGVPKSSTEETLSIITADAIMVHIPQTDIDDMRRGQSAMPDDVKEKLTLGELRDLVEFLANQTTPDQTLTDDSSNDE